jgi:hypothetical protein
MWWGSLHVTASGCCKLIPGRDSLPVINIEVLQSTQTYNKPMKALRELLPPSHKDLAGAAVSGAGSCCCLLCCQLLQVLADLLVLLPVPHLVLLAASSGGLLLPELAFKVGAAVLQAAGLSQGASQLSSNSVCQLVLCCWQQRMHVQSSQTWTAMSQCGLYPGCCCTANLGTGTTHSST